MSILDILVYMKNELKNAIPMAEAFARLLHPFAEVVIHDLEKDQIAAIYNPFSKRKVGDSSFLERWDFSIDPKETVIGPYEKLNFDGRKLKSISVVLRSQKGEAEGFLCVNIDTSVFEQYQQTLNLFLDNYDRSLTSEKETLFKDDLYEQINHFVQEYCRINKITLDHLSREQKQSIITSLRKKGAFQGKNATNYVARVLGISRATVYNYLKE